MSTLRKAHDELQQRAWLADEHRTDDAALLAALAGVADYLRRIADHGVTRHYRADKAGELVADALRVKTEALTLYGCPGDQWTDLLHDVANGVAQLVGRLDVGLWAVAQGGYPEAAQVRAMYGSLTEVGRLVDRLAAHARDGAP